MLNKERILIVLHKSGYIMPVYLLVKCIPSLHEGLLFMGFLKKVSGDHGFMQLPPKCIGRKFMLLLTDTKGHLLGFSRNCFKTLGLVKSLIYDPQITREDVCFSIRNLKSL